MSPATAHRGTGSGAGHPRRPARPLRAPRRRSGLGPFFALVAVLVILAGGAGATLVYARMQLQPVTATQGDSGIPLTVAAGESLGQVATDLQSQGVIRSATWFAAFARLQGVHLRAGRYLVDSGMGASELLARLQGPPVACPPEPAATLTVPEGRTVEQIAEIVASTKGLSVSRPEYLAAVAEGSYQAAFLSMRPAGDQSLEGFLFPATYTVPDCSTAHDIVQQQLDGFAAHMAAELLADGDHAYADLIAASIAQDEVQPRDFARVASVIVNRLKAGMDLQIDATVMYGLHQVGQTMSSADEAMDTPYNSYLHGGLPPTPIGNPGAAAIAAALTPASTNYLFYVSDACGNTYFSATEADHQKQVQEYLGKCP
ncbi:MAG TPA: endolytic transglycosylase MltG [Candidatus Binatia bacterium]|nr:endolytic transglycosylase MltG [Candidatus Binatia bacterium]